MLQFARASRDFLLYFRQRQLIDRDWRARHRKIFTLYPHYQRPCARGDEEGHRSLWAGFRKNVRLDTLRVCANISGKADPRIVPEEVFAGDIERCLNRWEWAPLLAHKSFGSRFLPSEPFPENLLHNIDGEYFDSDWQPLRRDQVLPFIRGFRYPVVCKPNTDSSGGAGVSFPADAAQLGQVIRDRADFVVQRVIRQHPFFEAFNACGLNTLRVYTYRSVTSGEVHVLNCALRLGKGGSLDNETAGGIVCFVHEDGRLNDYAVDKYGERFASHPDTGISFATAGQVPDLVGMQTLARFLAARLPLARLAGWDLCLDADGRWRCIEVNLRGHTIRFAQYAGQPFFGRFTDEVIAYCLQHPRWRRASFRAF
jgi:hypothetical protein